MMGDGHVSMPLMAKLLDLLLLPLLLVLLAAAALRCRSVKELNEGMTNVYESIDLIHIQTLHHSRDCNNLTSVLHASICL